MNGKQYEREKLKQGLAKAGINEEYKIVFSAGKDLVSDTAYKMLNKMFGKAGIELATSENLSGGKEIVLGMVTTSEVVKTKSESGELKISEVSEKDDGFEIKKTGDQIIIAGANGRGILYGVFEFEDYIYGGAEGELNRFVVPAMRKRSHGMGYYWNKYQGMIHDEFSEEKAEYMARLRINQYHAIQDGAGYGPHFYNLVKSPVFSFMNDPDPEYVRKTKKTSRIMKEYGVDYFQWMIEPILPIFAGKIEDYPPEVFGTKSPPDWYSYKPDGIEKTLCINHPLVQEYYHDVAKRFAQEYPDVKGVFLYNNDCEAWFCNPYECEKCQEAAIDPVGNRYILWENEMRINNIINAGLREGRADMESLFWPTVHFSPDEIAKMLAGTTGYTALTTGWDGADHDAMVADAYKEPNYAVTMLQEYEKKNDTPIYMYFSYNRNESLPQGFPYPYQMAHAIKRFYSWGVKNTVEGPGLSAHCNSINGLTMKAAETNPNLDIDAFLEDLCDKQFGAEAGKLMFEALGEIKKGMDVYNENKIYPFRGSSNHLGMGPIMHFPPSINIDKPDPFRPAMKMFAYNAPNIYKDGEEKAKKVQFVDQLKENADHFAKAAELAKKAADIASDKDYITYAYYDLEADEGIDRPTCKEYAEMNYSIIKIAATYCMEKVDKLKSARLYFDMEAAENETDRKELHIKHTALVKEDLPLQEEMLAMYEDFKARTPHLTRVGITTKQIDDLLRMQKEKIADLHEYLDKYADEQ